MSPSTELNDSATRYVAEVRLLADETNGRDEKPVEVGRKNLRLLLDAEMDDNLVTLPLARIRRDGAGRFVYDPDFVPPLLWIGASERIMTLVGSLCDVLDKKRRSVNESRRNDNQDLGDYYRRDPSSFWFLHVINSALARLRHQLLVKKGHPEELYRALVQLASALSCFSLDGHPGELPLFDHDDLGACFSGLERKIRAWLELMAPANCVSIPLKLTSPYFWSASVDDSRYFDHSRWILAITSKASESTIIGKTPQLVKVCSERFVAELVRRAVTGLALTHLPVPPSSVPVNVEAQYFSVTKAGPCWEHIGQTKRIGVYVPGDLPDPQVQLHIVMES